jgi:hypothetical protein
LLGALSKRERVVHVARGTTREHQSLLGLITLFSSLVFGTVATRSISMAKSTNRCGAHQAAQLALHAAQVQGCQPRALRVRFRIARLSLAVEHRRLQAQVEHAQAEPQMSDFAATDFPLPI